VNEPLELPKTEEPLAELTAELLSVETPAPEAAGEVPGPIWLRLAYAFEFLVALIAILNVWSEIGGQGHLDLMPWYIKLACVFGLAWCCVRFTAGIVEQSKLWTRRTITWFACILLFGIAMGGITYYYHLHEVPEDDDEDTTASATRIITPGVFLYDVRKAKDNDAHNDNKR
jgi:hypothetical protein